MNIYGDRGNVIALAQRTRWRGIEVEVVTPELGERIEAESVDLVFAGGGQDDHQIAVARDLAGPNGQALRELAEDGAPMLLICGTYQLFGRYFRTGAGDELPGIGVFDAHTVAGSRRMIGDALVQSEWPEGEGPALIGFENHSGQTYLGPGCARLGRALIGGGNNGRDGGEGARYRHVHGSYLHGPLLPKNPWLADRLIAAALRRRGESGELAPLGDQAESWAREAMIERLRKRGRRASGVV